MTFRCGFVAILGQPNVGKSTLLNAFVGQKIAAVTKKPQTTRHRILGICHQKNAQLIFIDTPGFHHSKLPLNRWMIQQAEVNQTEADVFLLLCSIQTGWQDYEKEIYARIKDYGKAIIIAINKIDTTSQSELLPLIHRISQQCPNAEIYPISAQQEDGLSELLNHIGTQLPHNDPIFPAEQPTDQTVRQISQEWIREKIMADVREEIPYSVAVEIEQFIEPTPKNKTTKISAVIHIERESQKGIIIGQGGQRLKKIGTAVRHELEEMIGGPVFLSLHVKVSKDWTKNPSKLKEFGYQS